MPTYDIFPAVDEDYNFPPEIVEKLNELGPVQSVNSKTGDVVLSASDVGAATSAQGIKADTAVQPGTLASVATSGSYNDLTNKPTFAAVATSGSYDDLTNKPDSFPTDWDDITDKPTFATVATTGSYNDLTDKPESTPTDWDDITDKPTFATVATTGSYNDLLDKPASTPTDWDDITDKPTFAAVATSGAYSDLSGTPTLATVATSGAYSDLSGQPTIPDSPDDIGAQVVIRDVTTATASSTAAKVVTVSGWTPAAGDWMALKFTSGNSASSMTINVNGLGAKSVYSGGSVANDNSVTVAANGVLFLRYDGTYWHQMGVINNFTSASQAEMEAGTVTTNRWVSPLRVAQAIAALSPVKSVNGSTGVVTAATTAQGALADTAVQPADLAQLVQWAKIPDSIITGSITRNDDGVVTSADVVWPNGATGTFTTDTIGTLNTIDAYHITYSDGTSSLTFTQSTITRDDNGAATAVPAITVA